MTHPHLLHATAAAWSLHRSREQLAHAAERAAADIAAQAMEPADGLQGWRPMVGRGGGGHGDPASGAALAGLAPPRINRPALLASRTTETLTWLANQLGAPDAYDPLLRLDRLDLTPATAATLCRWYADLDGRIRQALGMGPDRMALPGVDCPACQVRQLYVQTAAPVDAQTVICSAGCLCIGGDCPCGMPVRAVGVAHIWPRDAVVGAVAGAAPTQAA
jgi:hypothetical protein